MLLVMFRSIVPRMYPPKLWVYCFCWILSDTCLLCLLHDSEVSRWTAKVFGHWTSGSCESSMSIFGWVLARCVSGENKVTDYFGPRSIGSCPSGTQLSPRLVHVCSIQQAELTCSKL